AGCVRPPVALVVAPASRRMRRPSSRTIVQHVLLAATAALTVGARYVPAHQQTGPVLSKVVALVSGEPAAPAPPPTAGPTDVVGGETRTALEAFSSAVHGLSHPRALEDAFGTS